MLNGSRATAVPYTCTSVPRACALSHNNIPHPIYRTPFPMSPTPFPYPHPKSHIRTLHPYSHSHIYISISHNHIPFAYYLTSNIPPCICVQSQAQISYIKCPISNTMYILTPRLRKRYEMGSWVGGIVDGCRDLTKAYVSITPHCQIDPKP